MLDPNRSRMLAKRKQWAALCRQLSLGALALLLFLMPFRLSLTVIERPLPHIPPEFSSFLFYASDVLLLFTLSTWLAYHLLALKNPISLAPWFITLPLVWLVFISLLSIFWAPAPWVAAETAIRLLACIALYLHIRNEMEDFRLAAQALIIGLLFQSILAILQFVWQRALGLGWLGEVDVVLSKEDLWVRGFGLSRHPNILGGYLLMGLAAVLALKLQTRHSLETADPQRPHSKLPVWTLSQAIGVSGLLSTFSRSAWIGVVTSWSMAALSLTWRGASTKHMSRAFWHLVAVALLVATIFILIYPNLFYARLIGPMLPQWGHSLPQRVDHEMNNLAERADLISGARQMIATHLLTGVGSGNYAIASLRQDPARPPEWAYLPVHNVLLLITAELGLSGGLAWLLLSGGWLVATAWQWRRLARDPWFLAWSLVIWGLLVTSIWDFYIWGWQYGRLFFFTALGLWTAAYSRR